MHPHLAADGLADAAVQKTNTPRSKKKTPSPETWLICGYVVNDG